MCRNIDDPMLLIQSLSKIETESARNPQNGCFPWLVSGYKPKNVARLPLRLLAGSVSIIVRLCNFLRTNDRECQDCRIHLDVVQSCQGLWSSIARETNLLPE